ncbi:2-dehydro-3-deoxygalactonokinase [Rhodocytophaga rosea]|uniref:2-dehydro-3-deoxygalactonokinase n=1 Tax=Rhodocytophaga rosea TaxID=2704465 RepID=A0A6C0GNY1_9BACT|nr:2-dehydro-3-deoxygalactonokinase [Rhodocytophaga rosea]QHT69333.1 2-dehydro-3-deoxygalactonokinase [Rhodocytophaga rosea]
MNRNKFLLSCDWGTSAFRLRYVETDTGIVKAELTSQQGIAIMFTAYQKAISDKALIAEKRMDFYLSYLLSQIEILSRKVGQSLSEVPVIISGMASSTIGMKELSYTGLPFSLEGTDTGIFQQPSGESFPHELLLISGVKSDDDVMRGEETQLMGLSASVNLQNGVCIFPGTHSKHMYVHGKQMTGFKTFMTGELFQTIASHTILRNSIEKPETDNFEAHAPVFEAGVLTAANGSNLLHTLFTVRTGELFKKYSRSENYYYLSGLLIGQELAGLQLGKDLVLTLCCSSHLLPYYTKAIESLGYTSQSQIISGTIIDTIVTAGHLRISKQLTLIPRTNNI